MNDNSFSPTRTSVAISFRLVLGLLACIALGPAFAVTDAALQARIEFQVQQERFQSIDAAVKDGIATVHGTFAGAADVLFLKWRIAEIEGVILILIESEIIAQR